MQDILEMTNFIHGDIRAGILLRLLMWGGGGGGETKLEKPEEINLERRAPTVN
jgi:hypothetical protein